MPGNCHYISHVKKKQIFHRHLEVPWIGVWLRSRRCHARSQGDPRMARPSGDDGMGVCEKIREDNDLNVGQPMGLIWFN